MLKGEKEMYRIAVDIGGTKTIVGVIDAHITVVDQQTFPTITESPEAEFDQILEHAQALLQKYQQIEQQTLNIAMPGPCDYHQGIFLNPPNLQAYKNFDAGAYITTRSEFKPAFVNDTDAAIRAEKRALPETTSSFVYLTISTGVGMALVYNGEVLAGSDGNMGEIGHTMIKSNSDYQCPVCQQYGCVENEISGLAISRKASTILEREVSTQEAIKLYLNNDNDEITAMMEEIMQMTAQLCTNIYNIFNVYTIVLGGGVTQSPLPYEECITTYAQAHILNTNKPINVEVSKLEANVLTGLYDVT